MSPLEDITARPVLPGRLTEIMMIAGIPGAGKTTLAKSLRDVFGGTYFSTGDIARYSDPGGVSAGRLADEDSFRAAFTREILDWMHTAADEPLWLDGFPRTWRQLSYVQPAVQSTLLALTCRPDIARDRLLRRGRADDSPEIIEKRIEEQSRLLAVDERGGWLYETATWHATVNTSQKTPLMVLEGFVAYLSGEKREAA